MSIRTITDEPSLAEFSSWATDQRAGGKALALDTETTGLDPRASGFAMLVLCVGSSDGSAWAVAGAEKKLCRSVLRTAFASGRVWAHNADFDARVLRATISMRLTSLACTLTAARTCWPGRGNKAAGGYSLKVLRPATGDRKAELAEHYGAVRGRQVKDHERDWLPEAMAELAADDEFVLRYVAEDTTSCAGLAEDILANPAARFAEVDVAIDQTWRWSADAGLRVDRTLLLQTIDEITTDLAESKARSGFRLWTGNKARSNYLTNELGITLPPHPRTGNPTLSRKEWKHAVVPSGSKAAWEDFQRVATLGSALGKLEELSKASTPHRPGDDGRVRPRIAANIAKTGRMSISEPGLQNLTPAARQLFLPDDGMVLVGADLSHVEPSVMAVASGDRQVIAAVAGDIYQRIVGTTWGVDAVKHDAMTTDELRQNKDHRSQAKMVLLPTMYGEGAAGLANELGCSRAEAAKLKHRIMAGWPGLRRWQRVVSGRARAGKLTTIEGRPLVCVKGMEYRAVNYIVQGSAADLFKVMTLAVAARLRREVPAARLWLPIHDELVVQCPLGDAEAVKQVLAEEMTVTFDDVGGTGLSVTISAEPEGPWTRWQK